MKSQFHFRASEDNTEYFAKTRKAAKTRKLVMQKCERTKTQNLLWMKIFL